MRFRIRTLLIVLATSLSCILTSCSVQEGQEMIGTWSLASYASMDAELLLEGDHIEAKAFDAWLFARGREGFDELKPVGGMSLTIREDGTYSETKTDADLRLLWFDSEGVLVEAPVPTNGVIRKVTDCSFLHPVPGPQWMKRTREKEQDVLRYDDGDTLICDQVRLENAALVRLVSVVTDGLYLTRIIAIYTKTN